MRSIEDMLAVTRAKAARRRTRKARLVGATAAGVVMVGIAAVVVHPGRSDHRLSTTASSSDTAAPTSAVSQPDATASTAVTESTTTTEATPVTAVATSTTQLACRNSDDPACGPFYWDPQPENAPLVLEVHASTSTPQVGQSVTIEVHGSDADAVIRDAGTNGPTFAVDPSFDGCAETAEGIFGPPRYGPWDPPAPSASDKRWTTTVTFDSPGQHSVTACAHSYSPDPGLYHRADGYGITDPYASVGYQQIYFTVTN